MSNEPKRDRWESRALAECTVLLELARALHARAPQRKIDTAPLLARAFDLMERLDPGEAPSCVSFVRDLSRRSLELPTVADEDVCRYEDALRSARTMCRRAAARVRERASPAQLARDRRRRLRRWRVRAVAAALGLALSMGCAEMVLRGVAGSSPGLHEALRRAELARPPDATEVCSVQPRQAGLGEIVRPSLATDVVYELKPNVDTCFYGARTTINDEGVRGPVHYARPRPPDVYRILLLGDSIGFGQAVPYDDTFAARIQRSLGAQSNGRRVEVVNTSVPGYNTAMEVASYLATGESYEPECVIIAFCGNDLAVPHLMLPSAPRWRGSYLLGALHELRQPSEGDAWYRVADGPLGRSMRDQDQEGVPDEYRHMVGLAGYRKALTLLALAAAAKGTTVVNFADYTEASDVASPEEFTGFQRELGIVVPPFDYLKDRKYWVASDDPHPNSAGHAELAQRMLAGLEAAHVCMPGDGR